MSRPVTQLGHDQDRPLILGAPNNADARYVEGTGLFMAVRKGDRRWVTGEAVDTGLRSGVLMMVYTGDSPALSPDQLAKASQGQTVEPETFQVTSAPPDANLDSLPAAPPKVMADPDAPAPPKTQQVAKKKAPAKRKAAVKKAAAKKS